MPELNAAQRTAFHEALADVPVPQITECYYKSVEKHTRKVVAATLIKLGVSGQAARYHARYKQGTPRQRVVQALESVRL